ncbi:MAG TPA: YggS family pyridoxal phosphate-dependent enzyme [Bacteroidales bacterium]|nr:YggS family pyridoxal phosphate-dependent enzyme [Bacteroidales bacterium]HPS70739.1 YggS family pyridoxal phosphate-dependent enzyme [Bacteroidales bacterium]
MNIQNYHSILSELPVQVTLIAVSKTKPVEDIQLLYQEGQRVFGENRAQELKSKYEVLPKDIEWHFIGHLQTNKIKYIAPFVSLIHSVDSFNLLQEINTSAKKVNRIIPCLLQFYIAQEETKFGFDRQECIEMLESEMFKSLRNIEIVGVMGMATFTDDQEQIRNEFKSLHDHFNFLKTNYFQDNFKFKEISMGMTDDYHIAIQEGSTMIRIGSAIFGSR